MVALDVDDWLKSLQCLHGAFQANRSRLKVMFGCGLSHYRSDEVVSQDVRPDFLPHQFRRFAAQNVHLQSDLQRPQIEFGTPSPEVDFG